MLKIILKVTTEPRILGKTKVDLCDTPLLSFDPFSSLSVEI